MPFCRLACGWPAVFEDAVQIRDAMLGQLKRKECVEVAKPTKTQLIQIRDESYREQPVECCGTCRHFIPHYMVPHYSGPLKGRVASRCEAITLRGNAARKRVSYLGICDLYEPREDGAK